ncbi:MAG: 4-(cytidine 5'-diphospho)-2-C-methyl-D-erythritol kinase [Polaromonas sp.]|nr:4-(cytidine 5'-diphospho)-2-C-methyl-D-erythritol kinase [Polaromonas sp.]
MQALYDVAAPAKLNLFLHITGRRADGYHLLQSVFMLIDWCDTLHFELRTDGLITREDLEIGQIPTSRLPAEDLTVRAARALQHACGTTFGVHIGLEKRIPAQAGMGGGSSDAASCLLALQRLWGERLPTAQLQALALSLGADVPFFLSGGHAWVEGIGESITPISLPAARFVVVKAPAGLSTQDIFTAPSLKRNSDTARIEGFTNSNQFDLYRFGRNDLQPIAQQLCTELSQSIDWLAMHQLQGRMTGSGSAVFARLPEDASIDFQAAPSDWIIHQGRNLDQHPLANW